jgi:hypothetical protein
MANWDDGELSVARAEGGGGPQPGGPAEPVAASAGVAEPRYMNATASHLGLVRIGAMIYGPGRRLRNWSWSGRRGALGLGDRGSPSTDGNPRRRTDVERPWR